MSVEGWALGVAIVSAAGSIGAIIWARLAVMQAKRSADAAERANLNAEAQNQAFFLARGTLDNPEYASFESENIGKGMARNVTIEASFGQVWVGGDRTWDLIRPDQKVPFGLMMPRDTWNATFVTPEARTVRLSWTGQNGLPDGYSLPLPFVPRAPRT